MRCIVPLGLLALLPLTGLAQTTNHWRGPARDGIYHEKNLLREWPPEGPRLVWAFEGLGLGFSSPVFANGRIYVTGMEGGQGYVYILSEGGELLAKHPYGPERYEGYPGSRTSPAVVQNLLYMVSAFGRLLCMDVTNGNIVWERNLFQDFDGSNLRWGYTENLVIDGDKIFSTPGGAKYNVVALNRFTGDLIWSSPGRGDLSAYCSPLLVDHHGIRMLITMMADHIVGLDSRSGELLWSYPYANFRKIHPNTPIYRNGYLFAFSGYEHGGVKLAISADGRTATREWFNSQLDNQMGGVILHEGHLYGSGDRNRFWFCVDWATGQTVWQSDQVGKGVVIMADGMLYIYSERGELALVEPSPEGFRLRGKTLVTLGAEQHWAHPVIRNGLLYVRRGNALMAYSIGR